MVDEKVTKLAKDFAASLNVMMKDFPEYHLDFTWPTVGVLDYMVFPLRGKTTFSKSDDLLINSVAAYLGCIVHGAWLSISGGVRVSCEIREDVSEEITLRASGGAHLKEGDYFIVPLIRTIKKLLSKPPQSIPAFNGATAPYTQEMNLIGMFSRSLVSGLTSYGSGPWKDIKVESFSLEINSICAHLAQSSAEYYATRFPLEDLGISPEIYKDFLILPHLGYDEPFPGLRATNGLIGYALKNNILDDKLYRLALNLSASHDDLAASAGLSIASALTPDSPSQRLSLIIQARRPYSLALRAAINAARHTLKKPVHFLQQYFYGDKDAGTKLFNLERELGLLPSWFIPDLDAVNSPIGEAFVGVSYWNMTNYTRSLLDTLQTAKALSVELSLLQSYLAFDNGDLELAKFGLDAVTDYDSLSPILRQEYFFLMGLKSVAEKDIQSAKEFLKRATDAKKSFVSPLAYEQLISVHLSESDLSNACSLAEEAVSSFPGNFALRVLEIEALRKFGNQELANTRLKELVTLCPNSVVTFGLVIGGKY